MFTPEAFVKLCHTRGLWFTTLMAFMPDDKLVQPVKTVGIISDNYIEDPVIWEVIRMNEG